MIPLPLFKSVATSIPTGVPLAATYPFTEAWGYLKQRFGRPVVLPAE